jgi:predicted RNA-binding protein
MQHSLSSATEVLMGDVMFVEVFQWLLLGKLE